MKKLSIDFFNQPTLTVAKELLGKKIICNNLSGIITETEAYIGKDDPACHAAKGKTPRNSIMFGPPGHVYVYFIYGMYYCMNIVTETEEFPAAVLIRGIISNNIDYIKTNGPGKFCNYLGITKKQNGVNTCTSKDLYLIDMNYKPEYEQSPRIGIKIGTDKLWRFYIPNNKINNFKL